MAAASLVVRLSAQVAEFQKSFEDAINSTSKFEKRYAGLASSVTEHQQRINKAFASFSGDNVIREASEYAKAIERVGGTSKLTASELHRVGSAANEAVAKLRALGHDVPPGIQKLADALNRVEAAASLAAQKARALKDIEPPLTLGAKAAGLLTSAFAQFTLAGVASNAITSLASGLLEFANTGINKLPAVEASFKRLTLSIKQDSAEMLANMNTATKGMVSNYDLMLSANKAMLLGLPVTSESMAELAKTATILGKAMGKDATSSLDDLITALGRSSPLILDNLGLSVKLGEANEIYADKLGKTSDALTDAERKTAFYNAAMEAARKKTEELGDQARTLSEIAGAVWAHIGDTVSREAARINNAFGPAEQKYAKSFFETLHLDTTRASEDFKDLGRLVDTFTGKMQPLPKVAPAPRSAPAGVSLPSLSTKELLDISDALERKQKADDKAAAAARRHAEAIQALFDKFSGANATRQMADLDVVFRRLAASGQLTRDQIDAIVQEAIKLTVQGAKLTSRLWDMVLATNALSPGLNTNTLDFKNLGTQIDIVIPKIDKVWEQLNKPIPQGISHLRDEFAALVVITPETMLKGVQVKLFDVNKAVGELAQGFAQLGQIAGGSLGSIVREMGTLISSIDTANKGMKAFAEGQRAFRDGASIQGILGMATGLLGIASAAITAGKAIAGLFDRNKGRDIVEDFAAGFGGFDALHAKLLELGPLGEQLWIKLTQGVGRNNKDQARAAVEEVTAALKKQKETIADTTEAATKSGDAQSQATQKALDAIKRLDDQIASLQQSIANEAPEEVMGIIEANTRAQIAAIAEERTAAQAALLDTTRQAALAAEEAGNIIDEALAAREFRIRVKVDLEGLPGGEIPELGSGGIVRRRTLAIIGESGPEAVVPLSAANQTSLGTGGGTAIVEVDGRTLAEVVVPEIPGVVRRYGLA